MCARHAADQRHLGPRTGAATAEILHGLSDTLGLHALALEDITNIGPRPKIEDYDAHVFLIVNQSCLNHVQEVESQQISIFVSGSYVVSFCAGGLDPFTPIRERLRLPTSRLRRNGGSHLFHALLDLVVDSRFPVLEHFDSEIDGAEVDVLLMQAEYVLPRLHRIRRSPLVLRKNLWPQRETLGRLIAGTYDDLDKSMIPTCAIVMTIRCR